MAIAPIAGFLGMHLALSTFNDFGYRTALVPGILLVVPMAGAVAVCVDKNERRELRALAALALLGAATLSAVSLHDWTQRYYRSGDEFEVGCCDAADERIPTSWLSSGGCYTITDDETLWAAGVAGSHFNLMEQEEAAAHWDDHAGCVVWLRDGFNERVDELSVQDRALKLFRWYRWSRRGWTRLPDGSAAEVLQMIAPPDGARAAPAEWSDAADLTESSRDPSRLAP